MQPHLVARAMVHLTGARVVKTRSLPTTPHSPNQKTKTSKCLPLIFEIWRCKRVWKSSEKVFSYLEVKQCHKRCLYFDISYFMVCPYLPRIELQGKKLHFEILESLGTKTSMTSKPLTLRERFKMTSKLLKVAGTTHHKTTVEFVSQIYNQANVCNRQRYSVIFVVT